MESVIRRAVNNKFVSEITDRNCSVLTSSTVDDVCKIAKEIQLPNHYKNNFKRNFVGKETQILLISEMHH